MAAGRGSNAPLELCIKNGKLNVTIGVKTLAFSAEQSNYFNQFVQSKLLCVRRWKITNENDFAHDVMHALGEEKEDGSSRLSDLLDKCIIRAVEDGSTAVEEL